MESVSYPEPIKTSGLKKKKIRNPFNCSSYIVFWSTVRILFLIFLSQTSFRRHVTESWTKYWDLMRGIKRNDTKTLLGFYLSVVVVFVCFSSGRVDFLSLVACVSWCVDGKLEAGSPVDNSLPWILGLGLGKLGWVFIVYNVSSFHKEGFPESDLWKVVSTSVHSKEFMVLEIRDRSWKALGRD